jgi:hypothetical protein
MKIEQKAFEATDEQWALLGWHKYADIVPACDQENDASKPVWCVMQWEHTWATKHCEKGTYWHVTVMQRQFVEEGFVWLNCYDKVFGDDSEWDGDYEVLYWKEIDYPSLPVNVKPAL